jgi:hypothetical protein
MMPANRLRRTAQSAQSHRRFWRWLLLGAGFLVLAGLGTMLGLRSGLASWAWEVAGAFLLGLPALALLGLTPRFVRRRGPLTATYNGLMALGLFALALALAAPLAPIWGVPPGSHSALSAAMVATFPLTVCALFLFGGSFLSMTIAWARGENRQR